MTPWTVAHQTPLSMEFSRQEYWIGMPFPSPGDLPDPRIEPRSPALQADSLLTEPPGKTIVAASIYIATNSNETSLFFLHLPQHLLFLTFLITVILTGVR